MSIALLHHPLQVPGTVKGYSFLVDVHMDSGRLIRPWVSSLGAFWPGMQVRGGACRYQPGASSAADMLPGILQCFLTCMYHDFGAFSGVLLHLHLYLCHMYFSCKIPDIPAAPPPQALVGQDQDAVELHANFTAVWQAYGWLPEAYSIDTARINPEDPGYNLRPEHVESTYLLHAATGNPVYLKTARSLLHVSEACCGSCLLLLRRRDVLWLCLCGASMCRLWRVQSVAVCHAHRGCVIPAY